ncbi:MAG: AbrB/MazE/SpoVT family DNA-binding domain-containing protein [Candidatus Pacearchaeota archaeon]|jgi:phosphate uptake regulator
MESRKIQLVGKRTYAISLPKKWVIQNNLKEGNILFIEDFKDNELLIKTSESGIKQKEKITIYLKDIKNISEFIVFCYMKNIQKIIIKFDKMKKEIFEINKILKYLEGYEITNETKEKIEITFLFEGLNVNIRKMIKRIIYLLELMVDLIEEKDSFGLKKIEDKIDSLYFLSRRILFSCAKDPFLRNNEHINSIEDVFFYLDMVKKFEAFGDILFRNQKINYSKKDFEKLRKIIDNIYACLYKKQSLKFNEEFFKTNNKEMKRIFIPLASLIKDIYRDISSINLNEKFFQKN